MTLVVFGSYRDPLIPGIVCLQTIVNTASAELGAGDQRETVARLGFQLTDTESTKVRNIDASKPEQLEIFFICYCSFNTVRFASIYSLNNNKYCNYLVLTILLVLYLSI